MPETEQPASPANLTANFPHLTPDFCKGLVGDLAGLAEELDKGLVTQLDFLNFALAHLGKIDKFIADKTGGPTA